MGSISATPAVICEEPVSTCQAGTDSARLNLSVQATGGGISAWAAVQVLFALETTPYDGVFDAGTTTGGGSDPCWDRAVNRDDNPDAPICDESDGVPFFVANAGNVAETLQLDHPSTRMSFGLVDFGASDDVYDDSNGTVHRILSVTGKFINYTTEGWAGPESTYHVDIGNFVSANDFGSDVVSTFQRQVLGGGYYLAGSNLSTNILHSDSITALYGALAGVGLSWSSDAHHVIVWIGFDRAGGSRVRSELLCERLELGLSNVRRGRRPGPVGSPGVCLSEQRHERDEPELRTLVHFRHERYDARLLRLGPVAGLQLGRLYRRLRTQLDRVCRFARRVLHHRCY